MAYDAAVSGPYSGRPGYLQYIYVRRDQTDVANNRSTYAWVMRQYRNSAYTSWSLDYATWWVVVGGFSWSGSANCDFRSTPNGGYRELASGSTGWIYHNAEGYLNVSFACSHAVGSNFGTAEASSVLYTDRIATVPDAPINGVVDEITVTSARYRFYGQGNGGSPITNWQYHLSSDASVDPFLGNSSGTSILTGLEPGRKYYIRARGQNAIGHGPWSTTTTFTTLSGVRVGTGGNWSGTSVHVGVAGMFFLAEVKIGKGGSYVDPV